jgi:hypothetical protein
VNWIKLTAVFLIAAIFNPLCCCLDLTAQLADAALPAEETHYCCGAPSDEQLHLGKHTQEECPHSFEKDSQINEAAFAHDGPQKPQQNLAYTLPPLQLLATAPPLQTPRHALDCRALQEPSSQRTLAYCVYLI